MGDPTLTSNVLFQNEEKFYHDAELYWSGVEPTINGMLGGFGSITNTDIQGSELFLKKLFNLKERPDRRRALDCGAGIGRISKNLLSKYFDEVDLVEQNSKFVEASKHFLSFEKNIRNFYNAGLQNFVPQKGFYDVIWCQWVLGHLTDDHLVKFFRLCCNGLRKNGVIVVKENISSNRVIVDEEDSSVTRTEELYMKLFKNAGLQLIRHCKQPNFPKNLYIVKIFALKPAASKNSEDAQTSCETHKNLNSFMENAKNEMDSIQIIENIDVVNICDDKM